MTDILLYAALILAGFIAGVVNTVAGGGSFLTIPTLMFCTGLEPRLANATNRVAILLSSASATLTFRKYGELDAKHAWHLAWPTLCGAPIGILLAMILPVSLFEPVFGLVFLTMAILIAVNPKRLLATNEDSKKRSVTSWTSKCSFFAIGVYVGFIQAGMGILLLLAMSYLSEKDLVASSAIKNLIGFLVTFVAVCAFAYAGMVSWLPGLVMAFGNVLGGVVGARLTIQKGNRFVLSFLLLVMVGTGIKLLYPIVQDMLGW